METITNIDNIIKNIIEEVVKECKYRHIRASTNFISYYVNLLQLDPNYQLTLDYITNREKVQNFVKYVIFTLGNQYDPKILTLRLQHEFRNAIKELDLAVDRYRRHLNDKIYPLLLNIIEQENENTGENLYHRICYYITLASGLGNPAEKAVFQEALWVLKSVLDLEEIDVFPTLQNYIKQEVIKSLADLVTGIRLYNKSCKKGGEGMDDLPILMEKAISVVIAKLETCISQSVERSNLLTQSVMKQILVVKSNTGEWSISFNFLTSEKKKKWEYQRDLCAAHKQLTKTTRILLQSVIELNKHREMVQESFDQTIRELNKMVVPTLHQAVSDVFPFFFHLANIWTAFQDDAVRLKEIFNIFKAQAKEIFDLELVILPDNETSNFQKWAETENEQLVTQVPNRFITVHHKTAKFTKYDLEFYGYCCWVLTNTGGVLLPANISLGVVQYKKKLYGFSTKMAANSFIRNPDRYILKTLDLARKSPYLIKLLNLENKLTEYKHIKTLIKEEQPIVSISHQTVQTDVHIKKSIDYSHHWNIWDYKRAALRQKNLKTKITRSCETDKTHRKEMKRNQTYDMKSTSTQTKTDAQQNTTKPLRFLYGIRGVKERDFFEDFNNLIN